jgi:hypothetical protein
MRARSNSTVRTTSRRPSPLVEPEVDYLLNYLNAGPVVGLDEGLLRSGDALSREDAIDEANDARLNFIGFAYDMPNLVFVNPRHERLLSRMTASLRAAMKPPVDPAPPVDLALLALAREGLDWLGETKRLRYLWCCPTCGRFHVAADLRASYCSDDCRRRAPRTTKRDRAAAAAYMRQYRQLPAVKRRT